MGTDGSLRRIMNAIRMGEVYFERVINSASSHARINERNILTMTWPNFHQGAELDIGTVTTTGAS